MRNLLYLRVGEGLEGHEMHADTKRKHVNLRTDPAAFQDLRSDVLVRAFLDETFSVELCYLLAVLKVDQEDLVLWSVDRRAENDIVQFEVAVVDAL